MQFPFYTELCFDWINKRVRESEGGERERERGREGERERERERETQKFREDRTSLTPS